MIERIVAAVVDTQQITLYREDTTSIQIPQGDPLVKRIVAEVIPVIDAGGIAEIDLKAPNVYRDFEEQSGGLVRFFRVAKKTVAKLMGVEEEAPGPELGVHGNLPQPQTATAKAVEEIISQAEPVNAKEFREDSTTADQTMIAVVKNEAGENKVVPGVEQVRGQLKYSSKIGSTKGMERFLARVSKIIDQRPHSVQDLLRFLERGDLPIADDGSIVAYKKLFAQQDGRYVDPHTRKVSQGVGSYVCVDEKLVDLSRRNECSNGLHIGRRSYMGSFSGDTLMLCKIDPEDVMVVPHNDPNKVRVKGYHILAKLDSASFREICADRPATSGKSAVKLLSDVIAGNHIARLEEVRVHGQSGNNVVITPLVPGKAPASQITSKMEKAETKTQHRALDDKKMLDPGETPSKLIDPKKISAKQAKGAPAVGSRRQKASTLYAMVLDRNRTLAERQTSARELMTFKKTSKANWKLLGITPEQVTQVEQLLSEGMNQEGSDTSSQASSKPVVEDPIDALTPTTTEGLAKSAGSVRQNAIKAMLSRLHNTKATSDDRMKAGQELLDYRKKAKVSWAKLGQPDLNDGDIREIIAAIADSVKLNKKASRPKAEPKAKPVKAEKPVEPVKPMTKQEIARKFFNSKDWGGLLAFKQTAKKSWSALGFSEAQIQKIETQMKRIK